MAKWSISLLLLLLVLAFVAVYSDFDSVQTIDLDSGHSPPVSRSNVAASPNRKPFKIKSRLAVGERYDSLNQLVSDQESAGYLRIGHFGTHWPAAVAEITSDTDGIAFVKRDGTKHNYTGFDGYRMKMVRLTAGDRETIVVFRSAEKR